MNTLEANIVRSFSEVRKEIDSLRDRILELSEKQTELVKLISKKKKLKK